jgi:DNA-binding response OmpR family regulator
VAKWSPIRGQLPESPLDAALQTAKDGAFDIAILDVTIRGGKVYPVAEELIARGVPFILASGYGDWALPPSLREKRRLTKPFTAAELEEQVRLLFSEAARSRESS